MLLFTLPIRNTVKAANAINYYNHLLHLTCAKHAYELNPGTVKGWKMAEETKEYIV
jgi:hypothetical protein